MKTFTCVACRVTPVPLKRLTCSDCRREFESAAGDIIARIIANYPGLYLDKEIDDSTDLVSWLAEEIHYMAHNSEEIRRVIYNRARYGTPEHFTL